MEGSQIIVGPEYVSRYRRGEVTPKLFLIRTNLPFKKKEDEKKMKNQHPLHPLTANGKNNNSKTLTDSEHRPSSSHVHNRNYSHVGDPSGSWSRREGR